MSTIRDGNTRLTRRQLLIGGGTLLALGGLGAAPWQGGASRGLGHAPASLLDTDEFVAMGTYLAVTGARSLGAAPVRAAVAAVGDVERRMSFFLPQSEVGRLNRAPAGQAVEVSTETAAVLAQARHVHDLSGGAFDPTVTPVMRAWGFRGGRPARLPGGVELRDAVRRTGLEHLASTETQGGTAVTFLDEGMSLDLGGIAKGHAVDLAAAAMGAAGMAGLVNAGGDIRAVGAHPDGGSWTVGVRDPLGGADVFASMRLDRDRAVATSGTYAQHTELEGRRIPHVVDPRSGEPVDEVVSATVEAGTAVLADALATSCVVLGADDALKLLDRLPGVEGLLVTRRRGGHRIDVTSGFDGHILRSV